MDNSVQATGSINTFIEAIDRLRGYFGGYSPDMKTVTYNYGDQFASMKFKITVPDNRGRKSGNVEIPKQEGFRFREILAGGFDPVHTGVISTDDKLILDPEKLPSQEEYMIVMEKSKVDIDELENIIKLEPSSEPKTKNGVDTYWIDAFIKEPQIMADMYDQLMVENIDFNIKVGVDRCFSQAIPRDLIRSFKRTADLVEASKKDDFREVKRLHQLRKGTEDFMDVSEQDIARFIKGLANSESLNDYISVDSPYRREEIKPIGFQNALLPEQVRVGVSTNLSLDQKTAEGALEFEREEYTNYIEEETEKFRD